MNVHDNNKMMLTFDIYEEEYLKVFHKFILILFSLALLTVSFWFIQNAGEYYLIPLISRPQHIAHNLWKPSGIYGHTVGIIGTLMMVFMLLYSIRKRIKLMRRWGALPNWLNYHIALGIAGPLLITFHTSLKLGGLVSVAYWAMVSVVVSGFIGRYIYIQIPHNSDGNEISLSELKETYSNFIKSLTEEFNISEKNIKLIEENLNIDKISQSSLTSIFFLLYSDIFGWIKSKKEYSSLITRFGVPISKTKQFRKILKKTTKISRQIAFWNSAQKLFHYWHVIHKPFAYAMTLIVILHITISFIFGYTGWFL